MRRGYRLRAGLALLAFGLATGPAAHASAASPACAITEKSLPKRPQHYRGISQGLALEADIKSQTDIAIARSGAPLSPKYEKLPRIDAIYVDQGVKHSTIAAVTDGHVPPKGEKIELASRYRDPDQPCSFIPWTVVPTLASN